MSPNVRLFESCSYMQVWMEYPPHSCELEPQFLRHLSHSFSTSRSLHVWYQVSGKPPSSCQYPRRNNWRIQLILDQSLSHPYCHRYLSDSQSDHSSTLQSSNPTTSCFFADQFSFRPTGSTVAAVVALHTIYLITKVFPVSAINQQFGLMHGGDMHYKTGIFVHSKQSLAKCTRSSTDADIPSRRLSRFEFQVK